MPVTSARTLRSLITWFLFASAIVVTLMSGQMIGLICDDIYGRGFPASLSPELPAFSQTFLPLVDRLAFVMWITAALAIGAVIWTFRLVSLRETREHVISLVSAVLYYLVLMTWIMFVMAFFVLPRAKSGI